MSALLLARAARLLGWPPDSWRDGWPKLLTAQEIATLESCDETGKPDPGKKAAVLAIYDRNPMPASWEQPQGRSMVTIEPDGTRRVTLPPLEKPRVRTHPLECPPLLLFSPDAYRQWAARDWPPGPMVAAWLGQDEAAAVPQEGQKPKPTQPSNAQARAVELAAVLDAIEARARECGVPLVRSRWPGTKAEFRAFLGWHAPRLSWALPTDDDRLTDELRPLGVIFGSPGRSRDKGKKIYQALFSEYPA